jgi:hypothetical protein
MNGFGQRWCLDDKSTKQYRLLWVSRKKKTEIPEVLFLKTTINLGKWQPGQNVSLKVHAIYRWEKNKTFDETLP